MDENVPQRVTNLLVWWYIEFCTVVLYIYLWWCIVLVVLFLIFIFVSVVLRFLAGGRVVQYMLTKIDVFIYITSDNLNYMDKMVSHIYTINMLWELEHKTICK